jgi:hypothetical protein
MKPSGGGLLDLDRGKTTEICKCQEIQVRAQEKMLEFRYIGTFVFRFQEIFAALEPGVADAIATASQEL